MTLGGWHNIVKLHKYMYTHVPISIECKTTQ